MANSWQQPIATEPGGATWHKVADPATGWLASKTAGWVADRFSSTPTDCLTVDFSAVVPVGTRAVRVAITQTTAAGLVFWRKGGDATVSNTPQASGEWAYLTGLFSIDHPTQCVVWLSATYTADFAVQNITQDLSIAYPVEYLL